MDSWRRRTALSERREGRTNVGWRLTRHQSPLRGVTSTVSPTLRRGQETVDNGSVRMPYWRDGITVPGTVNREQDAVAVTQRGFLPVDYALHRERHILRNGQRRCAQGILGARRSAKHHGGPTRGRVESGDRPDAADTTGWPRARSRGDAAADRCVARTAPHRGQRPAPMNARALIARHALR